MDISIKPKELVIAALSLVVLNTAALSMGERSEELIT